MNPDPHEFHVSEEQLLYARWLDIGTRVGLGLLLISFALYVTGAVPPFIAPGDLPALWVLPVDQYLAAAGLRPGWSWLGMIHWSDMMNFAGIAFLALVTVGCYAILAASYLRKRDTACALIVLSEILVLVLAASGLANGSH